MTEQERIQSIQLNGGRHLQNFKKENITYAMCLAAVEDDASAILFVPIELRTEELCTLALNNDISLITVLSSKYLTKVMCKEAVRKKGMNLQYVPAEWRTESLCLEALCQDQQAFSYVPFEVMSPQFCIKAIKRTRDPGIIQSLPEYYRKTEFYMQMIAEYPKAFKFIPKKNRTASLCRKALKGFGYETTAIAVRKDPEIFYYLHPALYDHDACLLFAQSEVFEEYCKEHYTDDKQTIELDRFLRYPDVCEIALQNRPDWINHVSSHCITIAMCEIAVKSDGNNIELIPEALRSKELWDLAIQQNGRVINMLPEHLRTKDLLMKAFNTYPECLKMFPDALKTKEICLQAVAKYGWLLEYVPQSLRTYEMYYEAACDRVVKDIPNEFFDKKLALRVITTRECYVYTTVPYIFAKVPDPEVYLAAIKKNGEALKYVPDENKTYEMCLEALHDTVYAVQYIPDRYFTDEVRHIYAQNWVPWTRMEIPEKHQTVEMWQEIFSRPESSAHYVVQAVPKSLMNQTICDQIVRRSYDLYRQIPEEFISEGMIMYMAEVAPGQLSFRFPEKFRTEEFIKMLTDRYPETKMWLHKAGIGIGWFEFDE